MTSRRLFGRSVDVSVGPYLLKGLDCAFEIEKTIRGEPNTCSLKVWNLSPDHQNQLEQIAPRRRWQTKGVPVRIAAGYGDDRAVLWIGELRNVYTEIDGPDRVTSLDSGDGYLAFQNARVNLSYGPMTSVQTVFGALAAKLGEAGLNVGGVDSSRFAIAGMGKFYPQGTVISGSVAQELTDFCRAAGLEWSIQDGTLVVLDRSQSMRGKAVLLATTPENTGVIGSPSIDPDGIVTVKTLLNPDIRIGGMVQLQTERIKGLFRVEKATWSGDTGGDDWDITIQARRFPSLWDSVLNPP